MIKESFLQNIALLEKAFFESKTFEFLKSSGLDKDALAQISTEILKQALQGALSFEEMSYKAKASALEIDKMRNEMELSIKNAKMQIKQIQAEAVKSLIQAAAIIRSVSDNAAINKANAYVSFLNTVGNASEQAAIKQHAVNVINTISLINDAKMTDFDHILPKLISEEDADFGSKSVLIHTTKSIITLNEDLEIKGISTYGESECYFSVNDKITVRNSKNFIFNSSEEGQFKISFVVQKNKTQTVQDSLILKVEKGKLNENKAFFKKL